MFELSQNPLLMLHFVIGCLSIRLKVCRFNFIQQFTHSKDENLKINAKQSENNKIKFSSLQFISCSHWYSKKIKDEKNSTNIIFVIMQYCMLLKGQ